MSGPPPLSSTNSAVWAGAPDNFYDGQSSTGPVPLGGAATTLPVVNNPNLPPNAGSVFNRPPPTVPRMPLTPFPQLQRPPIGAANSTASPPFDPASNFNSMPSRMPPNPAQAMQNEANERRLRQLDEENARRRNATTSLQQMGTQILQGQMDVQEQVLQYQFMLEQCMETLDHQNSVINEQAEELALFRAKMRHFEYLMDAFKHSKEGNQLARSMSGDGHHMINCGDPLTLPAPSTSPFFAGGPTRVTASTFQPFNPRYRSPTTRAAVASDLNERRSVTPATGNANARTTANDRPSRRSDNTNNS